MDTERLLSEMNYAFQDWLKLPFWHKWWDKKHECRKCKVLRSKIMQASQYLEHGSAHWTEDQKEAVSSRLMQVESKLLGR